MLDTPYPHACVERFVEWVDTDASGHQHNSAILRWVEAAEAELFRSLDLPHYFESAPRVQQHINYTSKLWFGQRITATVGILKLGRTSLRLGFEVRCRNPENLEDVVAAHGTVTTAYVPAGATSAQPWPELTRESIKAGSACQHCQAVALR